MNYNVRAVKFSRGHDGDCMQCDLYNGKKKIAQVWDDSWGGDFQYTWFDEGEKAEFDKYVKSLGKVSGYNFDYDADMVVEEFVQKVVEEKERKRVERLCEDSIVIKCKNGYGVYRLKKGIRDHSQAEIDRHVEFVRSELKDGEYIVNTNISFVK